MTKAAALLAVVADALANPFLSFFNRGELWTGPELAIDRIHVTNLFDVSRESIRINVGGGVGLCYRVVFVFVCFHCCSFVLLLYKHIIIAR